MTNGMKIRRSSVSWFGAVQNWFFNRTLPASWLHVANPRMRSPDRRASCANWPDPQIQLPLDCEGWSACLATACQKVPDGGRPSERDACHRIALGTIVSSYRQRTPPVRTMLWLTRLVARSLGAASRHFRRCVPEHLRTARCGEMEAYFYLRSLGYRIVAKNFRSARDHGEIDLIGWDEGVLCFIEVKTHSQLGWCLRRSRWMPPRRATSGR